MNNKPDIIRTPDSNNTLVDVNLKVAGSFSPPNGTGFKIDGLQDDAVYIYVKTGMPTDVALQIYFNGAIYQLNQIGPKGDKGDNGVDGKSAYQVWLDAGNNGDVNAFFSFLKGSKGDTGNKGDPGNNGNPGNDGRSAYQVWIDAGNSGDINAFFAFLKGSKGDKGDAGSPGAENATLDTVCGKGADGNNTASTTRNIAAQTFFKISLRSAKRQIKDYVGQALKTINQLRVRTYKYKNNDEGQIGFIIDEIKDKSLINNAGTAINTDSLLAVAIVAIQELTKRVEALEHERMA